MKVPVIRDLYYNSIPEEDFRGRQRYLLFAALSLMSFIIGFVFYAQTAIIFKIHGWISYTMPLLSIVALINYVAFKKHKNKTAAFSIIILACFAVLHITTYPFGGIHSSSNFYLSVLTISTFILLGTRAGWIFVGLASFHMIVLYCLATFTMFFDQFQVNIPGALETDLTVSLIISITVLALICVIIERSNKRLIAEMEESHKNIQTYTRSVEKTNKELDSFAYIVSHDLKAPLRAINSLSSWIEDDLESVITDETKENFKLLHNRVERMEGLINGVLEYSRAGREDSPSIKINLREMITDVIFINDPPKNIRINIGGYMPVINSDKIKLQQVFANLISNAIKYNDKKEGIVNIICEQLLHDWKFTIADNGPGIEPQYRARVFDIFQTLQSKDKIDSTGIGLAIVKKIVEDSQGEIHIESNELGGASFIFTIPKNPIVTKTDSELKLKTA